MITLEQLNNAYHELQQARFSNAPVITVRGLSERYQLLESEFRVQQDMARGKKLIDLDRVMKLPEPKPLKSTLDIVNTPILGAREPKLIEQLKDAAPGDPPEPKPEPAVTEKLHAEFPPSSLEHYRNCPGFVQSDIIHWRTDQGSKLHKAWASGERQWLDEHELKMLQKLDEIYHVEQEMLAEKVNRRPLVKKEMRLYTGNITWGTADSVLLGGFAEAEDATIIDWKFGAIRSLPAIENPQGWCYVLGAFCNSRYLKRVKMVFYNVPHDDLSTYVFTREQHFDLLQKEIGRIISRATQFKVTNDFGMLRYHDKSCSFCARENCPIKIARLSEAIAGGHPIDLSNIGDMTPDQVDRAMILRAQYVRWSAAIKEKAEQMAEAGTVFPHFERVFKNGARSIKGPEVQKVWNIIVEMGRDPKLIGEMLDAAGELNIGELETFIKANVERGQKGKVLEKFHDLCRDQGIGQPAAGSYFLKMKPEVYERSER